MSIQRELDQIKNAVYGKEVREAIHDGIKKTYDDASKNGNANMEVEMARGTHSTLSKRLDKNDEGYDSITSQLARTDSSLNNRIDNIIATPTTVSEQEIIDARQGEISLGANMTDIKKIAKEGLVSEGKTEVLSKYPHYMDGTIFEVKESNIGKQMENLKKGYLGGALNVIIDLSDINKIIYPAFKTTEFYGSFIVDENGVMIWGMPNKTLEDGSKIEVDIPKSAKSFILSISPSLNETDWKIEYATKWLSKIGELEEKKEDEYIFSYGDVSRFVNNNENFTTTKMLDFYRCENEGDFYQNNNFRQQGITNVKKGRKYFVQATIRSSLDVSFGFGNTDLTSLRFTNLSNFRKVMGVIEPKQDLSNFGVYSQGEVGGPVNFIDVKTDASYYDLTSIFGNGNEPDILEIEQAVEESESIKEAFRILINFRINKIEAFAKEKISVLENKISGVTEYYYRGKDTTSIPVGVNALAYEDFITQTWEKLRSDFPNEITRSVVSKDQSGNYNIYKYVLEPKYYKKTVVLVSGVHGDEYEGFWSLYRMIEKIYKKNYESFKMRNLRHDVRFIIIPVVNPYGVEKRKRGNVNNVDCSKNFGINGLGGEGAFTEKESLSIKTVLDDYQNVSLFMDIHTDPYTPSKGNYISTLSNGILLSDCYGLMIDEIAYLKNEYNFNTLLFPNVVNLIDGNITHGFVENVYDIPSLIWETSVGDVAVSGSSEMMNIALNWLLNVTSEFV